MLQVEARRRLPRVRLEGLEVRLHEGASSQHAEVAYGVVVHDLSLLACMRRAAALLTTAELAFLFGMFLRPVPGELEA